MRPRGALAPYLQLAAGTVAISIALAAGYALASWRNTEARERLESSNHQLRESFGILAEGLREARRPLQKRIHELERSLEQRAALAHDATTLAQREPRSLEPGSAALAARVLELEAELASLRAGHARLGQAHASVDGERRGLVARVAELEARARTAAGPRLPDVAAAPPPGSNPACREGGEHAFDLRDLDAPVDELGGRLNLRFRAERSGLSLVLGDQTNEGFPLESLPQHVAFDCDGVPYVVSICEATSEPPRVQGVVWQADVWRDRCR